MQPPFKEGFSLVLEVFKGVAVDLSSIFQSLFDLDNELESNSKLVFAENSLYFL